MDGKSLEPWQARKIYDDLFPGINYLLRLMRRMEKRGFPPSDPLYLMVSAAYQTSWELSIKMHYISCQIEGQISRYADKPRSNIGKRHEPPGEQSFCDETGSDKLPQW